MVDSSWKDRHDLTIHVKRDATGWIAYASGLDGAVGSARRLEDATTQVQERAAQLLNASPHELSISWAFDLDEAERSVIDEVRQYQSALADAQMEYNASLYRSVRLLHEWGYTDRDAAFLLRLSHQRIAQVRNSDPPTPRLPE